MTPDELSFEEALEHFEFWLFDMDGALASFLSSLTPQLVTRLDDSPASLEPLEAWILERCAEPQAMRAFLRSRRPRWSGPVHRLPELTGFEPKPTPGCPIKLATASADRRTGQFIAGALAACLQRQATHVR